MSHCKVIKKKICLLGSFGVGKTSLIRRFVYDIFDDQYLSTIGVKVTQKLMAPVDTELDEKIQHEFMIWDIEGYEQSAALTKSYYTGAAGAIVVCDLTRAETIDNINLIIQNFTEVNPDSKLVLAANKMDLIEGVSTTKTAIKEFVTSNNYICHFTSALTGEKIEDCFLDLSKLLIKL